MHYLVKKYRGLWELQIVEFNINSSLHTILSNNFESNRCIGELGCISLTLIRGLKKFPF